MKTVPTHILPAYPCDDCGHIAWARYPLIGGKECICSVCYPVRTWSRISDQEYRAWHHKNEWKKPKYVEREAA